MARLAATLALCCLALLTASAAGAPNRRLLIPGGNWVTQQDGTKFYSNPAQKPPSEGCTDIAPDDRYTCQQQKSFGACDQSFMKDNNYCLNTCGRCQSTSQGGGGGGGSGGGGGGGGSGAGNNTMRNPSQINETTCTDVPPTTQYNCTQQFTFGKCVAPYMIAGNYCARSCGRPPCPPVANVPVAPKYANNATTTTPIVGAPETTATPPAAAVVAPGVLVTPSVTPVAPADNTTLATPVAPADNTTLVAPGTPAPVVAAAPIPATAVTTAPLPSPEQPAAVNVTAPAPTVAATPIAVNETEPTVSAAPPVTTVTAPTATVTPGAVNATAPTGNVVEPAAPAPALPAVATVAPTANQPANVTVPAGNVTVLNTTAALPPP